VDRCSVQIPCVVTVMMLSEGGCGHGSLKLYGYNIQSPEPIRQGENARVDNHGLIQLWECHRRVVLAMLEAANWAPTHGKTEPWRFVVLGRSAQEQLVDLSLSVRTAIPVCLGLGVYQCTGRGKGDVVGEAR
jgi:hypothetical protein